MYTISLLEWAERLLLLNFKFGNLQKVALKPGLQSAVPIGHVATGRPFFHHERGRKTPQIILETEPGTFHVTSQIQCAAVSFRDGRPKVMFETETSEYELSC